MADKPTEKSLEMRVAELEDKLAKVHISEEEMKAYQKVSALLGSGGGGTGAGGTTAAGCILDCSGGCINECAIRACTIRACTIRACTIRACTIRACTFECGGNCDPGGGGLIGGGGFGGFGG
jgi:hypothetical protein